jgi:hypothetical protein
VPLRSLVFSDKGVAFEAIRSAFFRRSEAEQVIVGIEKPGLRPWNDDS